MSQVATERRPATGQQAHWAPIEQVPERMRRMLEQTLGSFATPALLSEAATWTPLVDIEEEDAAYVIEAEVPGAKREDINIELAGQRALDHGRDQGARAQGHRPAQDAPGRPLRLSRDVADPRRAQEDRRQTQ